MKALFLFKICKIYKKSVNIGVVRLKDMCGREKVALEKVANEASQQYGEIPLGDTIYGIGGTATTLAAQVLGLQTYSSEKITGAVVTAEEMQAMADIFTQPKHLPIYSQSVVKRADLRILLSASAVT